VKQTIAPSLWQPLRIPIFRNLLLADVVSDVGTFLQTVGASWLMVSFGVGPMFVALTQTASSLPFFLLALPAGALGDIVDRRKLVLCTEFWMLGVAVVLAVATIAGVMTPWLLLALTFALSAGDAVEAPTWRALLPDLVKREDLTPATALNAIEFNMARAIGPSLGGIIIAVAGVGTAFALNALSFLVAIIVILRWTPASRTTTAPVETVGGATVAAIRYVRYSPPIRTLLIRIGSTTFFASALLALLAAIAAEANPSPIGYGLLLGLFGAGAVAGGFLMQPARAHRSNETLVSSGTVVLGAAIVAAAITRDLAVLSVVMLVAGAAWIVFNSLLSSLAQQLTPNWVRSRVLAIYMLMFQGSTVAGSTVWGFVAQRTTLRTALLAAGVGTLVSLLARSRARLPNTVGDPTIWNHWPLLLTRPDFEPEAAAGPVLVVVDYLVELHQIPTFLDVIHRFERVRRRDGATRWGIYCDREQPGRYIETFVLSSWGEHLRQHERITLAERELETHLRSLVKGEPEAHHLIYAHRLHGRVTS
jgi:MFS family permease